MTWLDSACTRINQGGQWFTSPTAPDCHASVPAVWPLVLRIPCLANLDPSLMVSVASVLPTLSPIHALGNIWSLSGKSRHVWLCLCRRRFLCSSFRFLKLVALLREKIANSRSLSRNVCVNSGCCFFVCVDFFTGDKASDLGRLLANQVFKLKDREGYLLRFTLTKTLRKGPPRSFALIPFDESEVCPVNCITYYLSVCDFRLPRGFFR